MNVMSDKGNKKPLFEIKCSIDEGGVLEVKTFRLRAKHEANANFEFGRLSERKNLNNVEDLEFTYLPQTKSPIATAGS